MKLGVPKIPRRPASPLHIPRGRDIMATCGQLKSESVKLKAKERMAEMESAALQRMPG